MSTPLLLQVISTGSKELQLVYLLILAASLYIFSNFFTLSLSPIFGLLLAVYLIYELYVGEDNNEGSFNAGLMRKISYLQAILQKYDKRVSPPRIDNSSQRFFLYLDPNLVNLLYSVRDFKRYAPEIYPKLISLCNDVLHLLADMQLPSAENKDLPANQNCGLDFITAQRLVKLANNYFHSFVYNLPAGGKSAVYTQRYTRSLLRFRLLTKRILDEMKQICLAQNKQQGISSRTLFIGPEYSGAKAYEPDETNFDFFDR